MELPWDKSSVWTVTAPFFMKGFVKGITGVLNLIAHKTNTSMIALIVLRDSTGTSVL